MIFYHQLLAEFKQPRKEGSIEPASPQLVNGTQREQLIHRAGPRERSKGEAGGCPGSSPFPIVLLGDTGECGTSCAFCLLLREHCGCGPTHHHAILIYFSTTDMKRDRNRNIASVVGSAVNPLDF